jgi:3-oxoacyl-[acyl-carrier-protein] synthase II
VGAQCRVVVTGMGVVAPNGIGLDSFWNSLVAGKSGVAPITHFDPVDHPVKIAGEVKGFNLRDYLPDSKPNRMSRQTQLALAACKMAVEHAGLTREMLRRHEPLRLVLGISSSAADIIEAAKAIIMTHGADRVRPYMVGACQPSATAAELIQLLGVQSSVTTVSNACPSGLDAIEIATKMIRTGLADCIVVGGADSPLNATGVAGFAVTGVLSTSTDIPPETVSRPFDEKRNGVVLAEGAGFLVLERMDSALARGANLLLEVVGAVSMTDAPGAEGMAGLLKTMDLAMQNASIYPEQVDYICANALSHPVMDATEAKMIRTLFGTLANWIPVSSIRGVMGHPLAPAGIFQTVACALSIIHRQIFPTANLTHPDPACNLDHVMGAPRNADVNIAMINAHGVSGENTTLLVKRVL